jgi:hypothetical protein
MKTIAGIILLLTIHLSVNAQKYITRNGSIHFFSKASLENIEAGNNQVSSVLDIQSGEIAFSLLMKAFQFEKALMQEHFNEKYVESDIYPKASFKGKLDPEKLSALSVNSTEIKVNGLLTIKGISKEVSTIAKLSQSANGKISGTCIFTILLEDYDIRIPSAVKNNISKSIEIKVDMNYEKAN